MIPKTDIMSMKGRAGRMIRIFVSVSLLVLSSCRTVDTGQPPVIIGGEGFLCLDMSYGNTSQVKSRAGVQMTGIRQESAFNSLLVVLYDKTTGSAQYIDYYTFSDNGTVLTATDNLTNISMRSPSGGSLIIGKRFDRVEIKDYMLAVVLNPGLENENLNTLQVNEGQIGCLGELLVTQGHNISILSTPLELSGFANGTSTIDKGIGMALSRMAITYPGSADYASDSSMLDHMRMVMSNADGLVEVGSTDIYSSATEAAQNPVAVNLERTLAKVAVFCSLDPDNLSNGGRVAGFSWACDIINTYTFLVRQPTAIAPAAGGGAETKDTPAEQRYASDPNFSGYSNLNGGTTDLSKQFFRLADLSGPDAAFYKSWNTVLPDASAEDWTAWEYVSENTMAAAEQFEDVMTRVVVRCNYIPGSGESTSVINAGESYYFFNGIAIANDQMKNFYENPATIPNGVYPELVGLAALVADGEVISGFGWPAGFDTPTGSLTVKGISLYKDGINYYKIPIRHFDDTLSPLPMGYGRYGVVRNNVYRVRITDITGPGSITIPDPGGEDNAKTEIVVGPWENVQLIFDL